MSTNEIASQRNLELDAADARREMNRNAGLNQACDAAVEFLAAATHEEIAAFLSQGQSA